MAGAAMLPQVLVQDVRGLGEGGVDVAKRDLVGDDLVGGEFAAHRRRALGIGRPAIGRRRQHVVIDRDQGRGVLGDVAIGGDHDRNGLADERHFAVRQRERPTLVEPRAGIRHAHHAPLFSTGVRSSSVSTATTPGNARAALRIDAANERVRMRTAHEGGVSAPGEAISSTKRPLPVSSV